MNGVRPSSVPGRAILLSLILVGWPNVTLIAQDPTAGPALDWPFRYELFRMLLEEAGLRPELSPRDVIDSPADSVIVMVGRLDGVFPPRAIESFCERGGSVLLATDQPFSAGRICEFRGGPVRSQRTADQYQNYPDCLSIKDIESNAPMMEGVRSLVVNRTGWLAKPKWFLRDWDVAARLPSSCGPRSAARQPLLASLQMSDNASGRLFLAADPSLFTNGMLWHGDNAILAINISKLLAEGRRNQMLFVLDGRPLGSYRDSPAIKSPPGNLPLPENLPEPELQTMLRAANSVIRNVEESNLLNETISNRPRHMTAASYRRSILFAIAALALAFVIWKMSANGPTVQDAMPGRQMKSAHDLSSERKVQSAEFGFSASMLARELCRELTGSSEPADWQQLRSCHLSSRGIPVSRKSDEKKLATIVDLAVNTRTVHISRRRFESVGRSIQELRARHRDHQGISSPAAASG